MYILSLVFSTFLFLPRFGFSDDANFDPFLYDIDIDSTQSSSPFFTENNNEFLAADSTLPNACAVPYDDLSFTPDQTNLFSRQNNNNECLPPVQIGTEALQLFESPLDLLENLVLPFKGQTSDNPSPPSYPGLVPDGGPGSFDEEGFRPYTGAVRVEPKDDSTCKEYGDPWGDYPIELCCNGEYMGREAISDASKARLATVDARTVINQDYAVVYHCLRTFFPLPFPPPPLFFFFWYFLRNWFDFVSDSRRIQSPLSSHCKKISLMLQRLRKSKFFFLFIPWHSFSLLSPLARHFVNFLKLGTYFLFRIQLPWSERSFQKTRPVVKSEINPHGYLNGDWL